MVKYKTYNLNVMENKDAISYYLLGVFVTDGCVKIKPNNRGYESSITSKDKEWLESINKILSPDNIVYNSGSHYVLRITNKEFTQWLITNKCTPRKSLNLQMPDIPKEYFRDFLRGCIDGDGCITTCNYTVKRKYGTYTYRKYSSYLCSSSIDFINAINKEILNFKLKSSITEIKTEKQKISLINGKKIIPKNNIYRIYFNDKNCIDLLNFLYYDKNILCLKRKQEIANQMIDIYNH